METDKNTSSIISLQDIENFPFPYKLWLIVNSETCEFSKWNIDGTEIELKISSLDNYLSSPKSIFKIKNRSAFIDHLRSYGFKRVESGVAQVEDVPKLADKEAVFVKPMSVCSDFVIRFKNEYFLRHRIDLLAKIRRMNEAASVVADRVQTISVANRREGDICFAYCGTLSKIQTSRMKYKTILNFQSQTKILQEKLSVSERRSKAKGHEESEEDMMIELPADLFENPHDSVFYMADEHRTAYAGFYGNCSNEQILKFFGDYLPMYESVNDEEIDGPVPPKSVASIATLKSDSNHPMDADSTTQLMIDLTQDPTTPPAQSSSLQPIFTADDEEDISMEEFIKFKDQSSDPKPTQTKVESVVKMTTEEEINENEINFKNFFSQYRESLSLLYEKQ